MGSVKRRVDRSGKWEARWRDPAGVSRRKAFDRKSDAERFLATVEHGMLSGSYVDPRAGRVSLGEWGRGWLDRQAQWTPKSRASAESLWRSQVEPRWGTVRLQSVRHADAAAWVAQLHAGGLSSSRVRQAYHQLKAMLDAAVLDGRLARNPVEGVALPRLPRAGERRYLDHGQVEALAEACAPYRTLVLVLAYGGLRWGEAAALRARNVDLKRGRVSVVEAVADVDGRLVVGEPKGHQQRDVPLPRFLLVELGEHLAGCEPGGLVWTAPGGGMLRNQNFRRSVWNRAVAECGLDGLVPHELRHTAASLAIRAGANVKALQRMLGHESAALTLDRYGHLWPDDLDSVAASLESARGAVAQRWPKQPVTALGAGRASA